MTSRKPSPDQMTRRDLLVGGATAAGVALLGTLPNIIQAQQGHAASPGTVQTPGPGRPIGDPTSALSARSPVEQPVRAPIGQVTGASFTPLQDLSGTITPTDLLFE